MSRVGKKPIMVPQGVKVEIDNQEVSASGSLGSLSYTAPEDVSISFENNAIELKIADKSSNKARSMWGLSRAMIANVITGVSQGFSVKLLIEGVGYRAKVDGNLLALDLGFSHPVFYQIPADIKIEAPKPTELSISGKDKQRVGQIAADIRSLRKPEPYKGKGIRYENEVIIRKEGKKGK